MMIRKKGNSIFYRFIVSHVSQFKPVRCKLSQTFFFVYKICVGICSETLKMFELPDLGQARATIVLSVLAVKLASQTVCYLILEVSNLTIAASGTIDPFVLLFSLSFSLQFYSQLGYSIQAPVHSP